MLSRRGNRSVALQDIPWRFVQGGNNAYNADTNPNGIISFCTAENALMHEDLVDFVNNRVDIPKLAYTYGSGTVGAGAFSKAMAEHLNSHFAPHTPVLAENIVTAAGLTSIHNLMGQCIGDPGDGILVGRPIYGRFELDFGNMAELEVVYADMEGVDPFSTASVAKYREALDKSTSKGINIKALMTVSPHNPLGKCYPVETIKALMALCQERGIYLISDEVYALSTHDMGRVSDTPFVSALSVNTDSIISNDLLIVLYGFSKDFAAAGLRLGSLITRNAGLIKAVKGNMRFNNPSGVSFAIGTTLLEDTDFVSSFIAKSQNKLRDTRAFTEGFLRDAGVRFSEGNAGFFIFVDLSPWLDIPDSCLSSSIYGQGKAEQNREIRLAQMMLDAGVALQPGEEHANTEGQFRIVFSSHKRPVLKLGLERMVSVLRGVDLGGYSTMGVLLSDPEAPEIEDLEPSTTDAPMETIQIAEEKGGVENMNTVLKNS